MRLIRQVEKNVTTPNTGEILPNTKENNQSVQPESQNPVVTPVLDVPPVPTPESPVPPAAETSATLIATPAIILTPETSTPSPGIPPVTAETTAITGTVNNQWNFQMEKPKLQRFAGDVRDYAIFKADFKHIVEAQYEKREAITILRASLQGKPLDMIKGIEQDYEAAWDYLDSDP